MIASFFLMLHEYAEKKERERERMGKMQAKNSKINYNFFFSLLKIK